MIKKLSETRRGVATIIGSILSIVILLFFFSNVVLWYNGVSRQMSLVMADKLNSQIELTTTVLEGTPQNCTGPPVFGGLVGHQDGIYGERHSGYYDDTHNKDNSYQKLRETDADASFFIALNATYSFNVNMTEMQKSSGLIFSFYGFYRDNDPNEVCEIWIWSNLTKTFENTRTTITQYERWYNLTIVDSHSYISASGEVKIQYLSNFNIDQNENRGYLEIDYQNVALTPVGLKIHASGGRSVRLLRLWIIDESVNTHQYRDFEELFGEIWVTGGSSLIISFGDENTFLDGTLSLAYTPTLGKEKFKILTDLGNTAATTYEA